MLKSSQAVKLDESESKSVRGGSGNGGSNGGGEFLEDLDSITDLLPLPADAVDSNVIKDVESKCVRNACLKR